MEQDVYEYSVVCPVCKAKTVLVINGSNLILFTCSNCASNIMLYKDKLFTLRDSFLRSIMDNYPLEECGKVVFIRKPKESSGFLTKERIAALKEKIDESLYLEDFLKIM